MSDELQRFEVDSPVVGVKLYHRDLDPSFHLDGNTSNISTGFQPGYSPRNGMMPIPGQSDKTGATDVPAGIMQSEDSGLTNSLVNRTKFYGYLVVNAGTYDDISIKKNMLIAAVADSAGIFSFIMVGNYDAVNSRYRAFSDTAEGLHPLYTEFFPYNDFQNVSVPSFYHFPNNGEDVATLPDSNFYKYCNIGTTINYCQLAQLNVSGKKVPMQYLAGVTAGAVPTANSPGEAAFTAIQFNLGFGTPSYFNDRKIDVKPKTVKFYTLGNVESADPQRVSLVLEYDYNQTLDPSVFVATPYYNPGAFPGRNINATALGPSTILAGRNDGMIPLPNKGIYQCYFDPDGYTNSGYSAMFAAPGKAMMAIVQDWQLSPNGTYMQWFDPTINVIAPISSPTVKGNVAYNQSNFYTEDDVYTATCFQSWPVYVTGTPLVKNSVPARDGLVQVTLGDADSGILRKNTLYEFTYSYYDKQIDFETNVGPPAKVLTGDDDFVAITFFRDKQTGPALDQSIAYCPSPAGANPPLRYWNTSVLLNSIPYAFNFLEFRVYYRQFGSYEWLPALFIDAAKYLFYPNNNIVWGCQAAVAALPGGQPGGFNDYSPLPKDNWFDVKTLQGRVFWCSTTSVVWSYRNNPFAYALRNSTTCPTGEFLGLLIHSYPGTSQQSSRVMIFGSEAIYAGTFTGEPLLQPVQVSADSVDTFPLDGSDFIVNFWTSYTAFSSRAATVADGLLYYWGPKGVFRDDGINLPVRISPDLEPEIFDIYDTTKTKEIHAVYNDAIKEIEWLYTAKGDTSGTSKALRYNIITQQFFFDAYDGKIDAIQILNVDNTSVSHPTDGKRMIAIERENDTATIQRAYYFDQKNRASDIYPKKEFMVKTVGALANNQVTITLADGFDATNFAAIAVGAKIAFSQIKDYTEEATTQDLIATVVSKSSPDITLEFPEEILSFYSGTLAKAKYFPAFVEGQNDFPYRLESIFWAPGGMRYWAYWLYCQLFFKIKLLPAAEQPILELSYETPVSGPAQTNDLTLVDNSKGNCQIYTQLKNIDRTFDGQGIKLILSGSHLADEWVLQYLAVDANPQSFDQVKEFEG